MKKAVIYGFFRFPRMSANANYAQYLALALMEIGYNVSIISPGDVKQCEYDKMKHAYSYKNIKFCPFELKKGKIRHYLDYNFGLGKYFINGIKECGLEKGDIAIGYIPDGMALQSVIKYCKEKQIITMQCVDELFGEEELKTNSLIYRLNYRYAIDTVIPKMDFVIPISHYIQDYYNQKNVKTFIVPIMADTLEYNNTHYEHTDLIKIIYPANGMIKDNLEDMLKALCHLPKEVREKIEFHITGIRKESINKTTLDEVNDSLNDRFIVHNWLDYNELIELYKKSDFLLLARKISKMTLANFPSKVPEVMTYGVIPIVSRVGDYTKYYLTDGIDSIIFDGFSSNKCCEAIIRAARLSTDERKKMSDNARKCVESKFEYRKWAGEIKEYFENNDVLV